MSTLSNNLTGVTAIFFMNRSRLSISQAGFGQVVKILITLEAPCTLGVCMYTHLS